MVGCLIVHRGRIIGEGWHRRAGEPHAEVNAIESVTDKSLLKDSELYVNLEPCSHHGRTPPCADLIVRHGIPKVIIGTTDDNALVKGKGIERLRGNGIEVESGILEASCRRLNRRFFTFHNKKRPYVILKWAESSDGFMFPSRRQTETRAPVWISNPFSRQLTHKWRSEEQAILVGTKTVIDDDPSLTPRDYSGESILRLVIDMRHRLNSESKVFKGEADTLVFGDLTKCLDLGDHADSDEVTRIHLDPQKNLPSQILGYLWEQGIQSLIVEGGAITLQGFVERDLWDEARIFIGSTPLEEGGRGPDLHNFPREEQPIGDDRLLLVRNESVHSVPGSKACD
jgi:diaminohydroxyphosphoribosylaminopyrimidine deaminase/5-amino-6-(5-phosphoribosylamino)uracil reductase